MIKNGKMRYSMFLLKARAEQRKRKQPLLAMWRFDELGGMVDCAEDPFKCCI
jgi:hypothetical protein